METPCGTLLLPYAGTADDEVFDVTPYAEAMTRYLLRHPLSSTLPRKFKIAFEGCADDHVATGINDIGWRARIETTGAACSGVRVTGGGIDPLQGRDGPLRLRSSFGDLQRR